MAEYWMHKEAMCMNYRKLIQTRLSYLSWFYCSIQNAHTEDIILLIFYVFWMELMLKS